MKACTMRQGADPKTASTPIAGCRLPPRTPTIARTSPGGDARETAGRRVEHVLTAVPALSCWWRRSVEAERAGLPMPYLPPPRDRDGTPAHWPGNDDIDAGAAA